MFANDKSIDNLEALFKEIKKYIELQGQYIKLDLVEKLTILISTLILILVHAGIYNRFVCQQHNCKLRHYRVLHINNRNCNLRTEEKNYFPTYGKLPCKTFP